MKRLFYSIFFMGIIFVSSCTKNHTPDPAIVNGYVQLIGENDVFSKDNSGVTVTVENSSPLISVKTNADGQFKLPHLTNTDTITVLKFEYPGYGTNKEYIRHADLDSIQMYSGGSGPTVEMHPVSSVVVNSFSGTLSGDTLKLLCNVSFPASNEKRSIAIFQQESNPVISTNDIHGFMGFTVTNGDNTISICTCDDNFKPYAKGDTFYLKAYGSVYTNFAGIRYSDMVNNKEVFSCANTGGNAATLSFVKP